MPNLQVEYYDNFIDKEDLLKMQEYCSGVYSFTDISNYRYVGNMLSTNSTLNEVWSKHHGHELIEDEFVQNFFFRYCRKIQGFIEASYNMAINLEEEFHGLNLYEPGNGVPLHDDEGWGEFANATPNGFSPIDFGVIIYLTESYEGGEIVFPNKNLSIKPTAGSIVAIPTMSGNSHLVNKVISGKRWVWASFWSSKGIATERDRPWSDKTMLRLIADKYYTVGKTGAEAVRDVWSDISDGKIEEICEELGMPEPLGLIHAINTFSKEIAKIDKLNEPRSTDFKFSP